MIQRYTAFACIPLMLLLACSDASEESSTNANSSDAALDTTADSGSSNTTQDTAPDTTVLADTDLDTDNADTEPDAPEDTETPDLPEDTTPDTATEDAAADTAADAPEDTTSDTATDIEPDSGPTFPLAGFGAIEGDCALLDDELEAQNSFLFRNSIDFMDTPYTDNDVMLLTEGSQEIIADGNAGGSSLLSEVFAFEMLQRCEQATLLKTENEVIYTTQDTSITDLLVTIDTHKIGVSVTRAVGFPRDDPYTVERARNLLEDKLSDILESSANVSPEDAWVKQILHVIAYAPGHADSIATAHAQIDDAIRSDTIVIVTVSNGLDEFLY